MSAPFVVKRLDDVAAAAADDDPWTRLQIRLDLGIEAFGANAYRADAGTRVIEEHDELGWLAGRHEELYVVASGRARFTVDGDELDAPRGTFVFVEPESKRGAIAEEDGTTVLVFGGTPGEAFKVSPWEATSDAWTSYQDKDYVTAADRFARVLADYPKAGGILYNLACCEALAGRGDPAVEHLRQAIAIDERFRAFARDDGDLDPIRERDDVRELLAAGDPSPPTT